VKKQRKEVDRYLPKNCGYLAVIKNFEEGGRK
jgi:hypothetical protein